MTPSPTPTPTTDACFYRDAQFNGSTVHVLVDAFGRMLVMDDDSTFYGVAWNDSGLTSDFESDGDHAEQFNAIRTEWGENDRITDITDEYVEFTDDSGDTVRLDYDSTEHTFPTVNQWVAVLTYQYDEEAETNYLCDADGKIISTETITSGENVQVRLITSSNPSGRGYWGQDSYSNTQAYYEQKGGIRTVVATMRQDNGIEFDLDGKTIILDGDEELNTTPILLS